MKPAHVVRTGDAVLVRKQGTAWDVRVTGLSDRRGSASEAALLYHETAESVAMRAEEAMRDLEKFIDDAVLAGVPSIRIVHGKGEGILRKLVHDYLKKNPNVSSYRLGQPSEGGDGVTVATFK